MTSFESLGFVPEILQALRECGYAVPTPIQEQAIPPLLAGRDLMGCAQTGTGKTAAFALPILQSLARCEPGRLRALILVPTRELAIQVGRNIREYSEHLGLRSTAVYGGVPLGPQEMMLRYGVDLLVATPGRLKDHMWRGLIDFAETRFLVLDEADRMLDMGFIDAVREIVREIPHERQTMLFSATLEPEIQRLARDLLRSPVRIEVAPPATVADGIEHVMVRVEAGGKRSALEDLVRERDMDRTLIFTRTRRGAHQLALQLRRSGHRVSSIHSDKTQGERVAALEAFREGRIDLLVATDIAARGLDVEGISHVVNYDLPRSAEDYVHRIGRTARAGRSGMAVSLVTPEDRVVLSSIEKLIGRRMSGAAGREPALTLGPRPRSQSDRHPRTERAGTVPDRIEVRPVAAIGPVRDRPTAVRGAIRDQRVAATGPVRDRPAAARHTIQDRRAAGTGPVPAAARGAMHDGPVAAGPGVPRRRRRRSASGGSARREPQPRAGADEPGRREEGAKGKAGLLGRVFSRLGFQSRA